MTNQVPDGIRKFLENSTGENLDNFQVEIHDGNKRGEGSLGDFFFVSLTNKKTDEVRHLAIKQVLSNGAETSMDFVSKVFQNESCFYDKIWPQFTIFQKGFPNAKQFRKISKCYAVETTKGAEKISLENLRYHGFRNHVKSESFKKQQLEYVLRAFGEFHAISMAFRTVDPEKFQKVTMGLVDITELFGQMEFIHQTIRQCCRDISSTFDKETERQIIEKFKIYEENGWEIVTQIQKHQGNNYALLHGDCWSNNFMFKYDEHDDIEDMRLIDFQTAKLGSVVFDISHCIYASGSKESFDNLDHYLRIYHQSLSEALKGYGLDPEQIYPYIVFKQEWKLYSKFGLMMGLIANSGKYSDMDEMPLLTDLIDEKYGEKEKFYKKSEKFLEIGRNLILHGYNNGYL